MRRIRVETGLVGAAVVVAALACGTRARASGEGAFEKEKHEKGDAPAASAEVSAGANVTAGASAEDHAAAHEGEAGEAKGKEEGKEEEEEKTMAIGIDFVVGTSTTDAVSQNLPAGAISPTGTNSIDAAKVTSYSFLIGGGVELGKGWEIGARIPFQTGTLYTPQTSRGTSSIGNIEIEPEYAVHLNPHLELRLALGIALPTAPGAAIPESVDAIPQVGPGINQEGYDRATMQHAVAMARGFEENALFEPQHMGIIPKVTLSWHEHGKWHLDPWVKVENLIATDSAEKFIGELVFGANFGYQVSKVFEPGLRLWANVPLTGADFKTVAVVEPDLRFHCGHDGLLMAGVILPIAGGALTSPYGFGVRVGAGIRF